MHFPKLTPLQSRLAACLGTSIILLIIYFSLSPTHFAYAAELDSIHNQDHNHHRIPLGQDLDIASGIDWGEDDVDLDMADLDGTAQYQAEFAGLGRDLIGRAPLDTVALKNNQPNQLNISPGETQYYIFENSSVFGASTPWRTGLPTNISREDQDVVWKRDQVGSQEEESEDEDDSSGMERIEIRKRQSGGGTPKMVYISVNTCLQPSTNDTTAVPPQLTLYVSTSNQDKKPGPSSSDATSFPLTEGYVEAKVNATGNLYLAVVAPNVTSSFSGQWNYFVAASIDASYYYYNDTTSFVWTIDTDSTSALMATYNLTSEDNSTETLALRKEWMKTPAPFGMIVYNQSTPLVNGIRNSYCGLQNLDLSEIQIERNMTERGMGSNPKQQFYISGLRPGQKYTGVLTYNGVNSSTSNSGPGVVGGGGQLWKAMNFTTKNGTLFSLSLYKQILTPR
jgi:calcium channel MID1